MQTSLTMQAFKTCLGVDHLHRAALGHILNIRADPARHTEAKRPHLVQHVVQVVLAETGEWYEGLARRIDPLFFHAAPARRCRHRRHPVPAPAGWGAALAWEAVYGHCPASGPRRGVQTRHGETSFN
jgi:hypothetical protein